MSNQAPQVDELPLDLARRLDPVCDRFEDAWLAGGRPGPRLEDFLPDAAEPDRPALLRELLWLDLEYRGRDGERPPAEEYRRLLPEYAALIDDVFATALQSTGEEQARRAPGPVAAELPVVAGYEVLGELGRGGMGVVYRARHLRLKREVALKMARADLRTAAADLTRFQAEAEAVARLQHPNIVQIYEVGEQGGLPYFSLEFCAGGSLAKRLRGTPLPPRPAAEMVAVLARAIHHAHQHGVVHRDLKPGNILLAIPSPPQPPSPTEGRGGSKTSSLPLSPGWERGPGGEGFLPKITDFGLAKRLEEAGQTETGSAMGTPSYMAPEQAQGKSKEIGPAADVYALGAVLYECLTGRPPFRAATTFETLQQVVAEEPVLPRSLQPGVPRDLETVCLRALQKDRQQRYASALALAEDLERWLNGTPIVARRSSVWERAGKWARRRPAVAALVALLVCLGVVAFGLVTWQWRLAEAERQKGRRLLARLSLGQGQSLCDGGDTSRGILWQAHALELIPEEDGDLRRAVRASLAAWRGRLHPLRNTWTHPGPIQATAFSPDGRTVLTVGTDHGARLWETESGHVIGQPLGHPDRVLAACCRPDGTILTGCADGGIRSWKAGAPQPHASHSLGAGPVLALAFSADGRFVAAGRPSAVQLWETDAWKLLAEKDHQGVIQALAVSADGTAVLTGTEDGTVRLWEVSAGEPLRELGNHRYEVRALAFSPDGRFVLSGSEDYTAQLWERATGKPVGKPLRHQDVVQAVAFAPMSTKDRQAGVQVLLTASRDGTARLWQKPPGQPVVKPLGSPLEHHSPVGAAAFSPDGRHVLTGDQDQRVWLWEVADASPYRLELKHPDPVMALAVRPDGRALATGSTGRVRLWEIEGGKELDSFQAKQGEIWALAFSPDGRWILTDGREKTARLWDAATHKELRALPHSYRVRSVAFSRDGRTILTGSGTMGSGLGAALLWDGSADRADPAPLEGGEAVWAVAFGTDQTCAVASGNNAVRLWGAPDRPAVSLPPLHRNRVVALAFSPDGRLLLTGSMDRTARLWNAVTGAPVGNALLHPEGVLAVAFTQDGRSLVTGSQDGGVRFWDTATGMLLGPPLWHEGDVWAVACHPGGGTVFSGSDDQTVRLWPVPAPVEGLTERVVLWTQIMTAMELDEEGTARPLDVPTWQQRRRRLADLGGPPLP
jgi:WD40 repeat protein/serine/threonine protein kinase